MGNDQDIVGSREPEFASEGDKPSKAGYGQNGYHGASSDLPGEHTTSGFLPQVKVPVNSQLRDVSKQSYPIHPGMAAPRDQGKIPDFISYPSKK